MFQVTSKLSSVAQKALENKIAANTAFNDWTRDAIIKLAPYVHDAWI